MKTVGVREFKQRASEILREVRQTGVAYDITYRGGVIATLAPARKPERAMTIEEWDSACDALAADIEAHTLPEYRGVSAVELIREGRDRHEIALGLLPPLQTKKPKRRSP